MECSLYKSVDEVVYINLKILDSRSKGFTLFELIIVLAVILIVSSIVVFQTDNITDSFKKKADLLSCEFFASELTQKIQLNELSIVLDDSGANQDAKGDVETALNSGTIDSPRIGHDFYYTYVAGTDGGTLEVFVGSDVDTKVDSDKNSDGNQFVVVKVTEVHSID